MVAQEPVVALRQTGSLDPGDLRRTSVQPLALVLFVVSLVSAWYYLPDEVFHSRQVYLSLVGVVVAGVVNRLAVRRPLAAALLLCAGEYGLAIGAARLLPGVSTLLLCLPIVTSAVTMWPAAPLLAAAVSCAAQYGVRALYGPPPLLAFSVVTYLCLGAALYLTGGPLHNSLSWSWKRHTDALVLAEQLRDRQGELNRTVAALNLAYHLLQRTNHELAEARQEAEDARRLKEQFAANISHELRTPLNLILGFSEMMYLSPHVYGGDDWSPALRNDVAQVYSASRHLSQLVDDVLDLSRLDAERMPLRRELTSLATIIEEAATTARELTRQRGIELRVCLEEAIPRLFVDATRIRQVMLNLLSNAIRYTDSGEVAVCAERREGDVHISVSDSGVGIADGELESIFDEFYQAETAAMRPHKGMGLGLAIAKRFVTMHGGRIWAESKLGQGSTFHVSLPLDASRPAASRLHTSRAAPLPANPYAESIVLLGGGGDLARLFERHLSSGDQAYRVLVADGAEQVDGLVAEHHPRAVIRNLSLAGMREMGARLSSRTLPPDVPVVYAAVPCTAWRAELLGAYASLQKPVERHELLALLRGLPAAADVLVVDDDLGFANVMTRMLQSVSAELQRPLRVRAAYDGVEGLAEMRQRPPDVLFLDLRMPEPDGQAVMEAMRADERLAEVPVVVVTAGDIDEEADGLEAGFIALAQRHNWKLGDSLRAIGALLDLTRPKYGEASPQIGRDEWSQEPGARSQDIGSATS